MLILYKERRNKIKNKNNSKNKNNFRLQTKLEKSLISKDKKINRGIFSDSKTINYDKYDKQIHDRIIELGHNDNAWDDNAQSSVLWKEHTPGQEIMCNIIKP